MERLGSVSLLLKSFGMAPVNLFPERSMLTRVESAGLAREPDMVPIIWGVVLGKLIPVIVPSTWHWMVPPQVHGSVLVCQDFRAATWLALVMPALNCSKAVTRSSGGGGGGDGMGDGGGGGRSGGGEGDGGSGDGIWGGGGGTTKLGDAWDGFLSEGEELMISGLSPIDAIVPTPCWSPETWEAKRMTRMKSVLKSMFIDLSEYP